MNERWTHRVYSDAWQRRGLAGRFWHRRSGSVGQRRELKCIMVTGQTAANKIFLPLVLMLTIFQKSKKKKHIPVLFFILVLQCPLVQGLESTAAEHLWAPVPGLARLHPVWAVFFLAAFQGIPLMAFSGHLAEPADDTDD